MLHILSITFPFFALVLCGYLAARRGLLPLQAIPGMNGFVLFFALPCMLYRFGASTPIAQLLDPGVALTYVLCALVMVGLLGPQAAGVAIVTIVVDMVVTTSLCIALSRLGTHGGASTGSGGAARQALKNALKGVATNPMPWAIFAGALVSALQWALPPPVVATVGLLADAASPVALFTIGAVLARSQMLAANGHAHPVPWQEYVPIAAIKLFLHPLLVLLAGTAAMRLGVPLKPFTLTVLVLLAALPSASNVSLLAERFGADNGRIARIILVSTAENAPTMGRCCLFCPTSAPHRKPVYEFCK